MGADREPIAIRGRLLAAQEVQEEVAVEIADIPAAISTVQRFIATLERGQKEYSSESTAPYILPWRDNQIIEQLPLIVRIEARVDTELPVSYRRKATAGRFNRR